MDSNLEVDSHKLMYHPKRVSEWLEKGDCFPIYVEIGLTNKCNHKCIFCALDYLEHGSSSIDTDILLNNLENMAKRGVKSAMFAGEGEPLLHKDIDSIIKSTKEFGLDVSMTTNGILFNNKRAENILPYLKWIRFSIDAGTKEIYSKIHGTRKDDFEKVIQNIRDASNIKKFNNLETTIGTQFLLLPDNLCDLEKSIKLVKESGANNIQIKPYSQHPGSKNKFSINYEEYMKIKENITKFNDDTFEILFREKTIRNMQENLKYNRCYGLPFFSLIDSKGNVIPCNLFYNNEKFTLGNIYANSFEDIWNGRKRGDILKKLDEKGIADCRKGCRLDKINKYLYRLKNPCSHDNFI